VFTQKCPAVSNIGHGRYQWWISASPADMVGFSAIIYYCSSTKQPIWRISVADFGLSVMVNISRYGLFFCDYLILQRHNTDDMANISGGFWSFCYGKYQPIWQVFPLLSAIAGPQNRRYGKYQWQILASVMVNISQYSGFSHNNPLLQSHKTADVAGF
jgi:hypothetical protein